MKKRTVILLTLITLILTFIFAEIFSIYHFGSVPTLLTSLYLISIFATFEYLSISITYIIGKLIKRESIERTKITGLILLFVALLLILWFVIVINVDWLNWYAHYSTPFYINVIVKAIMYLLPSIILIIVSFILLKKEK